MRDSDWFSHECAAEDCDAVISRGVLMCREHWRMVPRPLQRRVWRCWRRLKVAPHDTSYFGVLRIYRAAVDAAVESVRRHESGDLFT
jgi:hypothetical protein